MLDLSFQNSHWFGRVENRYKKNRRIYKELWKGLTTTNLMSFLIGPRRVGKSVILKQLITDLIEVQKITAKDILYWEFSPHDGQENLSEVLKLFLENVSLSNEIKFILLDEIQYVSGWESLLKLYYDNKTNLRFVLTGSLSLSYKRRMEESLAGRFLPYYIYQLDFEEYLDFLDKPTLSEFRNRNKLSPKNQEILATFLTQEFNKFLSSGRYPGVLGLLDSQVENYISTIELQTVSQDTLNYFDIERINIFKALFDYYKINSGKVVSFNKISSLIGGTSVETISKYTDILELLRLIYIVPNSSNPLKINNSTKKIYTNSSFTLLSNNRIDNLGEVVESYVLERLLASKEKVNFYRQRQSEVDFVLWQKIQSENQSFSGKAIEIKYQNQIRPKIDFKNLLAISKKLKLQPFLFSKNLVQKTSDGISIFPACLV